MKKKNHFIILSELKMYECSSRYFFLFVYKTKVTYLYLGQINKMVNMFLPCTQSYRRRKKVVMNNFFYVSTYYLHNNPNINIQVNIIQILTVVPNFFNCKNIISLQMKKYPTQRKIRHKISEIKS